MIDKEGRIYLKRRKIIVGYPCGFELGSWPNNGTMT
jgi:hypothetical protein